MRFLFVKTSLAWPRATGHDVHAFHMMQALARLGHDVALMTQQPPPAEATAGLELAGRFTLGDDFGAPRGVASRPQLSGLQERFRRYYGIETASIASVAQAASAFNAGAVVAVGLDALPLLSGVSGPVRIWYAADEWAWHHLTQVTQAGRAWSELRQAAVKGLYERAYAGVVDRVWIVSDTERRAMRWLAGMRTADVLPNGVDADYFGFQDADHEIERSAIFWGRLDFGPNIQALEWFCRRVWPMVRAAVPDARFTILGYSPSRAVVDLTGRDGIELRPDVVDLRPDVRRHALAILPFVSGSGIKNKLLEAASLGKAIVCTPRACEGLRHAGLPMIAVRRPDDWVAAMTRLWADRSSRTRLGQDARQWVARHHTWAAAAETAAAGAATTLSHGTQ
jgi:glycosyltransferase involved in cell wall biosynthesis